MPIEDLRQSPMMGHMLDALGNGEDIGHYGRKAARLRRLGEAAQEEKPSGILPTL